MIITIMYHVIYNASYNLFAALLADIENKGAQNASAAVAHRAE